jgi:aminomethyltransferase
LLGSGAVPAGLGARDVLRLEAGLPLYGRDMDEGHNPFEARLEFVVDLEKPSFVGRDALLKISHEGITRWLMGVRMMDKGIPREGYKMDYNGEEVGEVTSGTYSPTIKAGIAMGYVHGSLPCGTTVSIRIREKESRGVISEMPFYSQEDFGWKRRKV